MTGLFFASMSELFFSKLRGDRQARPARPPFRAILFGWLGGFLAISTVALLTQATSYPLVLGSFGASCVLVFGFPDVPFSQPRHVIGGHFVSSLIGLTVLQVTGPTWWGMAFATGAAIAAMMAARIVHPPAGSNPVIIFLLQPAWSFLWFPTLTGSLLVLAVALIFNNLTRPVRYPKYW